MASGGFCRLDRALDDPVPQERRRGCRGRLATVCSRCVAQRRRACQTVFYIYKLYSCAFICAHAAPMAKGHIHMTKNQASCPHSISCQDSERTHSGPLSYASTSPTQSTELMTCAILSAPSAIAPDEDFQTTPGQPTLLKPSASGKLSCFHVHLCTDFGIL